MDEDGGDGVVTVCVCSFWGERACWRAPPLVRLAWRELWRKRICFSVSWSCFKRFVYSGGNFAEFVDSDTLYGGIRLWMDTSI